MKVLLTGGGTGGHIYPAIAIADEIKYKHPDAEILFAGRTDCIEGDVVPKSGYEIRNVTVYGFERFYGLGKKLITFFKMFKGFYDALKIIKDFKPDVVVGTGGFVSGPVVLAATLKGIKTLIHEQNAVVGFTVNVLSSRVDTVCVSFESTIPLLEKARNVVLTGNPVRRELSLHTKEIARDSLGIPADAKVLLCFGGSQGSQKINESMVGVIKQYLQDENVFIIHVTGPQHYNQMQNMLLEQGISLQDHPRVKLIDYAHNMPQLLACSDLVICRSGALTIAEVTNLGLGAIYIPYPFAVHNHQYENAKFICDKGGALLIEDEKVSADLLISHIDKLFSDLSLLKKMGQCSLLCAHPKASALICDEVEKLME